MPPLRLLKTSFTAGAIAPELYGRSDLAAYENGASKLTNVFVLPTGGVARRDGLRHLAEIPKTLARIAAGVTITTPQGGTGASANDDDAATKLATTGAIGTVNPYVAVRYDLGAAVAVRAVDVLDVALSAGASADEFRVQYSANDSTWTDFGDTVPAGTKPESARRGASGAAIAARYWRFARIGATDLGAATISLSGFHLWQDTAALAAARLVAFEFNATQTYALVFVPRGILVYSAGALVAELPSPYAAAQIDHFSWAQNADTLLLTHPDFAPKRVVRRLVRKGSVDVVDWRLSDWRFLDEDTKEANGTLIGKALRQPYHKFADIEVTVTPSATTRDAAITVTASAPVFDAKHVGLRLRIEKREVEVTAFTSATVVGATVKETLKSTNAVRDWEEPAFSALRGWPASCAFHQDRLAIGGSRDLPNRLWLSKAADLFNFDLGEGLDDEAIEFAMLSDQVDAIRAVFSGRHLQVLTAGGEWMVAGDPLTPEKVQLKRQTRIGTRADRYVPPRDVDGATLFASRSGRELHEFLFADVDQAYQSNNLATLARPVLAAGIVDLDYDAGRRLLHAVLADGRVATVTVYRTEQVTAWSTQATDGAFRSVATAGGVVHLLVERAGRLFLERFDAALGTDAGLGFTSGTALTAWPGFGHLDGREAAVVADGLALPPRTVAAGTVTLDVAAKTVEAGLAFTSEIEPLPPAALQPRVSNQGMPVRLVAATFRFSNALAVEIDWGHGFRPAAFRRIGAGGPIAPAPGGVALPFSGDLTVRALGWRRGLTPLWRLRQTLPLPFTLLSVSAQIKPGE